MSSSEERAKETRKEGLKYGPTPELLGCRVKSYVWVLNPEHRQGLETSLKPARQWVRDVFGI